MPTTAIGLAEPADVGTRVIHVRDTQPGDVYVGRRSNQMPGGLVLFTAFGNPFRLRHEASRPLVINQYRRQLLASPELLRALPRLRGKRLACWCHPQPCHADVLVDLLNRHTDDELRAMADRARCGP